MDASGNVPPGDYQLSIRAIISSPDIPLMDNDPGPAVQVVLRSRDGENLPESKPADSTDSSSAALTPLTYSVSSLPSVASQPVGQPQPDAPSPTELAWVDQSSGTQSLPAGFTLRGPSHGPAARFSVAGVSGTIHDPLPDAVPHGIHALNPSTQLVSELAALFRERFDAPASSAAAADSGLAPDSNAPAIDLESGEWIEDSTGLAMSPPTLALGMVASLGAASIMTVPNRRRSTNWLQQAVELLGL
jgi:hypothetical protein